MARDDDVLTTISRLVGDVAELQRLGASRWGGATGPLGFVVPPGTTTSNVTSVTTVDTDTGLAVTFTPLATRRYRITYTGALESSVAGDVARFKLTNQANTVIYQRDVVCGVANGGDYRSFVEHYNSSGPTGFKVRFVRAGGTGNIKFSASATSPGWLLVEDIGPA